MLIKFLRRKKGLSQMALAEMLKVSQGAISQWESGTTKPSLKHLLMLSSIFSCSINELFEKREG